MIDRRLVVCTLALVACSDDDPAGSGGGSSSASSGAPATTKSATTGTGSTTSTGSAAAGGGGGAGGSTPSYTASTSIITSDHRFIDGQMFGGWGPHLGHSIDAGANGLWFVDDVCAQPGISGLSPCDVNDDHTLGWYRRDGGAWSLVTTASIPGAVQQNTATISSADGATLFTFGLDVAAGSIIECAFDLPAGPPTCGALPFPLVPSSNYIGAAISPDGYRVVWWTGVVDGGGGSFHYIVDYGGGWNGPRSGGAAGYNDASYIGIGFPTDAPARFVMHVQLVSGLAPAWSFFGGMGTGDLTTSDPVTFSLPLAPVTGDDPVVSTNDVWVDPASQDEHVIARTEAGRAAYYHRPPQGSWSGPLFSLDATYRARFVAHGDRMALVYGPNGSGLAFRVATAADLPTGSPIDWAALEETPIPLPAGYDSIYAIYPAGAPYQVVPGSNIEIAVVGAERQYEVLGVSLALTR
ncbi:MAG: hypothetical protein HOV80_35285 [Polyangiaceae bacterium]|nr:hypothetical protein [Polyangiaceae bacterium]